MIFELDVKIVDNVFHASNIPNIEFCCLIRGRKVLLFLVTTLILYMLTFFKRNVNKIAYTL